MNQATDRRQLRDENDFQRRHRIGLRLSEGVALLPPEEREELLRSVAEYGDFTEETDPYGEHDFGVIDRENVRYYWKIESLFNRHTGEDLPRTPYFLTHACGDIRDWTVLTVGRADEFWGLRPQTWPDRA